MSSLTVQLVMMLQREILVPYGMQDAEDTKLFFPSHEEQVKQSVILKPDGCESLAFK